MVVFSLVTALFHLVVVQAVAGNVGAHPNQHRWHGGKRQDDGAAEVAVRELRRIQAGRQQLGIGGGGITRDLRHLALAKAGDEVLWGGVHHALLKCIKVCGRRQSGSGLVSV